jgi:uncharacterized protein
MLDSIRNSLPGIGFIFDHDANAKIDFEGLGSVTFSSHDTRGIDLTTRIVASEHGIVMQRCTVTNKSTSTHQVKWRLRLCISVNRASYGQLTEGGPIPLPKSSNCLELGDGGTFAVTNRFLEAKVQGCVGVDGQGLDLRTNLQLSACDDAPVTAVVSGEDDFDAGMTREYTMVLRLSHVSTLPALALDSALQTTSKLAVWNNAENQAQFIVRRNLEYILGNCTVPLPSRSDVACLITDHVALPLGWNRDN